MARTFDGIDDQIAFGSDAATDQLAAFTAYTVINIGSTITTEQPLVTKFTSGFIGKLYLFFQGSPGSNAIGCYMNRNGGNHCYAFSNNGTISNSTWTVVVSTWAGSGAAPKIYTCTLGGTLTEVGYASSNIGSGTFFDDSSATLRLGARDAADVWYAHGLADSALWNRVLTAGELADLGTGDSPEFITSGLVFSSRITGSASPEINFTGGTNGTVTGTTLLTHPSITYPSGGSFEPAWARGSNVLIGVS